MEMVVPTAPASPDFHFISSGTNSPYATAPSSPKPFGKPDEFFYYYTSAPASPTRASAVYSYLTGDRDDWQKVTTPRFGNNFDFAFGPRDVGSTADELFDKGRIKPLKPPPAPRSQRGGGRGHGDGGGEARGSERASMSPSIASSSGSNIRDARSLSPLRGEGVIDRKPPPSSPSTSAPASSSSSTGRSGSKKWRLKNLLLFRSASEGRATGGVKDPLRKYTLLSTSFNKKRSDQDINKSRSFNKTPTSAHELHYTANRAAAEEQKKKTALPYHRNTFFGWLHFNPAVQSIARGFGGNAVNHGGRP